MRDCGGPKRKRMPRCSRAEAGWMKYVYILQSETEPDRFYVGSTHDLQRRLQEHNAGQSIHTNKYKPWQIKTYLAFEDDKRADAFEAYLKTGSGRAFAKKRL